MKQRKKHWSKEAKRLFRNRLRARRRALNAVNTVKASAPAFVFGQARKIKPIENLRMERDTLEEACNDLRDKITKLQLENLQRDKLKDFLRPALELINNLMKD